MPNPAYMTIVGTRQGLITAGAFTKGSVGNVYQQGHEDQVLVQALSHSIFAHGGAQSGYRIHEPLIITKTIDKSSPLINIALRTGEALVKCRIDWYRTASEGVQEHYYTTELEDALIVGVEVLMPHCQDSESAHFTHLERVHIAYRKIHWSHEISATFGDDEWNSRG